MQKNFSDKFAKIDQDTIILSKPGVSGDPLNVENSFETFTERADFLHEVVPHAEIVFIIRNQIDFIISSYRQYIRVGHALSLDKFTNFKNGKFVPREKGDDKILDIFHLDFASMADYYTEKFGEKNVHILFFEELNDNPDKFISNVQKIIGCEFTEKVGPAKVNAGLSALGLNISRLKHSFSREKRRGTLQFKPLIWAIAYLEKYDQKNTSLKKILTSSLLKHAPAIILRRLLMRFGTFLVFDPFMQLVFNKIIYIDWDLMGKQKRAFLTEHYSKPNQGLLKYFRNPEVAKYYGLED